MVNLAHSLIFRESILLCVTLEPKCKKEHSHSAAKLLNPLERFSFASTPTLEVIVRATPSICTSAEPMPITAKGKKGGKGSQSRVLRRAQILVTFNERRRQTLQSNWTRSKLFFGGDVDHGVIQSQPYGDPMLSWSRQPCFGTTQGSPGVYHFCCKAYK